jgi:hypothetical protein
MRSCPACGASVADTDDFCGNCGTYLGWGTKADDTPATVHDTRTTDTGTDIDQPAAVQPAKPVRRRPTPSVPVEVVAGTGPPCPVCGTPNPPGRRFCRRCATPLTDTTVVAERKPWWRRIRLPRFRLGGKGFLVRRLVILIVLTALVLAGILLFPLGKGLFEDLLDKTTTPAPIGPVRVVASAEVPGHPGTAATDGLTNRYWGAPKPGDWIEFTFDHPFRLLSLVVHAGPSADREQFTQEARPAGLDVIVTSAEGSSVTRPVELADQPGPQTLDLGISDVVRIRVVLRSATGLSEGKHIAVGEIEFFQRS